MKSSIFLIASFLFFSIIIPLQAREVKGDVVRNDSVVAAPKLCFLQIIGSTSFTLPCNFNLSVSCFYNTKRKQGNLTIYPMLSVTPRIEKRLGKQWAISLGAEDILQRVSRVQNSSNGYDVVSHSKSHIAINLGVTYKFNSGKRFNTPKIEKNADVSRLATE